MKKIIILFIWILLLPPNYLWAQQGEGDLEKVTKRTLERVEDPVVIVGERLKNFSSIKLSKLRL